MKSRVLSILCLIASLTLIFSGCQKGSDDETKIPTAEPYPYDFRCGYMLTFDDPNNVNYVPPTSDDFTSDNAIARYVGLNYYGNSNSSYLYVDGGLFVNNGHNEIAIKNDPLATDKSGSISMHEELFYTSELNFKQAKLYYVYYNAEQRKLYTEDYCSATFLNSLVGFGVSDEMEAKIINADGEFETITYKFELSIDFKEIDTLQNVIITEYSDSEIQTNSVVKSSSELKELNNYLYKFNAKSDSQYIIISKQYKNSDGKIYTERSLYNKNQFEQAELIYVPYGNGLTQPMEIQLSFSN